MDDNEISPYITMTKVRSGEKLQIEQKYVKIREGQNKLMAVSYQSARFRSKPRPLPTQMQS